MRVMRLADMIGGLDNRDVGIGPSPAGRAHAQLVLRRIERRQAMLLRLTESTLRAGASAFAAELAREAVATLDLGALHVYEWRSDVQRLVLRASAGELAQAATEVPLEPGSVERRALSTGAATSLASAQAGTQPGPVAFPVGLPQARWGLLVAVPRPPRRLRRDDVDLLTALGHMLASVVEREQPAGGGQPEQPELSARVADLLAHDLNNVLAALGASAAAIAAELPTADGFAEDFQLMNQAVKRGSRLLRRLVTFVGTPSDRERAHDLVELVTDARMVVERLLLGDVAVEAELPSEAQPVRAVLAEIEPLLVRLLMSAAETLAQGSTLRLHTRHLPADPDAGGLCRVGLFLAVDPDLRPLEAAVERSAGRLQLTRTPEGVALICPCADPAHELG